MDYSDDSSSTARRRWAASVLGIEPDASAAQARSALLKQLAQSDCIAPLASYEAIRVFGAAQNSAAFGREHALRREEELSLRDELCQFREAYWKLEPSERRSRWESIHAVCATHPLLARQLTCLIRGLSVDVGSVSRLKDEALELANELMHQFVMRPLARADRRRSWLEQLRAPDRKWSKAVKVVRQSAPKLIALDPSFIESILDRTPRGWFERRRTRTERAPTSRTTAKTRSAEPSRSRPSVWFALFAIALVTRLIGTANSRPSAYPPNRVPNVSNGAGTMKYSGPRFIDRSFGNAIDPKSDPNSAAGAPATGAASGLRPRITGLRVLPSRENRDSADSDAPAIRIDMLGRAEDDLRNNTSDPIDALRTRHDWWQTPIRQRGEADTPPAIQRFTESNEREP